MTAASPPITPRADIQALRALAVVAVVLFHLDLMPSGYGYLGVDVFFVISGFLIGGKLEDVALTGQWAPAAFWKGRMVRLWPAANWTMTITWLGAALLLDRYEYHKFLWQMLGGVGFSANMVLWKQIDYFSNDAAIKPLLHMWSLAVEEQFYLLLPLLFLLRRGRLIWLSLMIMASFGLWLYARQHAPSAGFYLLPARGWELGCGVALAMTVRRWPMHQTSLPAVGRGLGAVIAAGLLVALLTMGKALIDEGAAVPLAVVLTGALLVWPGQADRSIPVALVGLGNRSYALYLTHWPIIALVNTVWLSAPPVWARLLVVAAIVASGELLYRAVDHRRRNRQIWRSMLIWHGALALMAVLSILRADPDTKRGGFRAANEGLGLACNKAPVFRFADACRSGPHPQVLVWGDSFAMQLVPGLASVVPRGVVQATHVVCGPIAGIAPTNDAYPLTWAADCIGWNESVLAALRQDQSIRYVVLASILSQYVENAEPGWQVVEKSGGTLNRHPRDNAALSAAWRSTIAQIRAMGKDVIVYRPQPYADFDIGRCLARAMDGMTIRGAASDCSFSASQPMAQRIDLWLNDALKGTDAKLLDPVPTLCPARHCIPMRDGVPLFADRVHLSQPGSAWVLHRLPISSRMIEENP